MGIDIKQEKHNKSANQKKKKEIYNFFLYNRYMYISISKGRQLFC